jgi:hypothetical protein
VGARVKNVVQRARQVASSPQLVLQSKAGSHEGSAWHALASVQQFASMHAAHAADW